MIGGAGKKVGGLAAVPELKKEKVGGFCHMISLKHLRKITELCWFSACMPQTKKGRCDQRRLHL